MNLSLNEYKLIVEALDFAGKNLPERNTIFWQLADKIEKEKFSDNLTSFSPDDL